MPSLSLTHRQIQLVFAGLGVGMMLAALDQTNVATGSSVPITLRGSDPNGGVLTYAIVAPPANGSLSGTPPNVIYAPDPGFFGFDSFTFKANDGVFDSAPATVTVKVVPPPMARASSPCRARSSTASSTECGCNSSNERIVMTLPQAQ